MRRPSSALTQHEEEVLGKAYDTRLIRRLWRYVHPYRGLVVLSVSLLFGVMAVQLAQPYLVKIAIDDYIGAGTLEGLAGIAALFLLTLVAEFALRFSQLYVLENARGVVV